MKKSTQFSKSTRATNSKNWKQTSFASQYRYDIAGSRARRFQSAYLKLIGGTIFLTFVGVLFFVQIQSRLNHPTQMHPVSSKTAQNLENLSKTKSSQNLQNGHISQITSDTRIKTGSLLKTARLRNNTDCKQFNGLQQEQFGKQRSFGKMKMMVKKFFQIPLSFKQFQYRQHRRRAEMLLAHIKSE